MSETCKKVFITTPIYYVNDVPHIGHAYTTIISDVLARYSRLIGLDTFFLTGTDEHGQKIEEAAKKKGKQTQEYANEISGKFQALWDEFGITYDKYIRTTDQDHKLGVQKAFEKMYEKGDIYKGEYEGNYCVSCETFFTSTQLIDDEFCPDCGKITKIVKEESYFFKLSKYEKQILDWYENDENCILPKSKKNEVISFVKEGLKDLSITRTSFDWGVKLPQSMNDPKHVMYVWLDALLNYVTALGFGKNEENMEYWPAKVQVVGKDILKFHAIYWPAFLLSLELELPKHIAAHGWWTRNGEKMSKSKGNVVDPREVANSYGLENFRYFLLREVPFGQDGDFSQKALIGRINNDLGNDFGNLINRIIGMSGKYFDFKISSQDVEKYYKKELDSVNEICKNLEEYLFNMQLSRYLENLWKILQLCNQSITTYEPWNLMKNGKEDEAMALIGLIANSLAKISLLLNCVMPENTTKIAKALNFEINTKSFEDFIKNGKLLEDFTIEKIPPLFPKIEENLLQAPEPTPPKKEEDSLISIDDFFKSQIKVGTITKVDDVDGSDKLYKVLVELGESSPRQLVAGIKKYYEKEELLNTQVCVVANLKPAKIMGIESNGMILAAKKGKKLTLVKPDGESKNGAIVG